MVIKKAITILLVVFIMVLKNQSVKANAKEDKKDFTNPVSYQLSEYDVYVSIRARGKIVTGNECVDHQTFLDIYNIEAKIFELSKMKEDELHDRGMNADQINIFKSYDGSKLEDNPQLREVLATLTVTLTTINHSSSSVKLRANWSWNNKPLIMNTDCFETAVFRWKAYNSSGVQITATYNSSGSYCNVSYYNGNNLQTTQSKTISVGSSTSYVYSQFKSSINVGDISCWAKTGYMVIQVTGSNIAKIDFGFGYNHGISSTPCSITLDSNLGFNYSNGFEMAEKTITVNN